MKLFGKLSHAEAGRLEHILHGGLKGADDGTWDDTAELIADLRKQHPQVPPESLSFRLPGRQTA